MLCCTAKTASGSLQAASRPASRALPCTPCRLPSSYSAVVARVPSKGMCSTGAPWPWRQVAVAAEPSDNTNYAAVSLDFLGDDSEAMGEDGFFGDAVFTPTMPAPLEPIRTRTRRAQMGDDSSVMAAEGYPGASQMSISASMSMSMDQSSLDRLSVDKTPYGLTPAQADAIMRQSQKNNSRGSSSPKQA